MRTYGKIIEYDGLCGTILTEDGIECLCLKKDFKYNEIKIGDVVSFIMEKVTNPTDTKMVAYFIEKVEM